MKNLIFLLIAGMFAMISCERNDIELEQHDLNAVAKKPSKIQATVVGTNDPLIDPVAVQEAVDNYDVVNLSGVFNFGFNETTGGVDITRPNIILKGPATIRNGGKPYFIPGIGTPPYPLSIRASGVEVHDLTFIDNVVGIVVDVEDDGKSIIVTQNTIESVVINVAVLDTECGIKVLDNDMQALFGYYGRETMGYTAIFDNNITAYLDGVNLINFDHRVDILNNTMNSIGYTGVWIGAWLVTKETGPDWGDNPPVRIIGNSIDAFGQFAAGIGIGTSAHGINNVMVKDNTITGELGFSGLLKEPFGRNNTFMKNDLSGLTTDSPQIWVMGGHHNHYKNNKLGAVKPFLNDENSIGYVMKNAATLVCTVNWHDEDVWLNLDTPDPLNYANHFSNNDYRQTGVLGWTDDPESFGAILLLDFLQRSDGDYPGNFETEPFVMENYVAEHKFPAGTDVCTQVLDLSNLHGDDMISGNNHIAGWMACETQVSKSISKSMSKRYEKLGQAMSNRYLQRMKARENILKDKILSKY